MQTHCSTQPHGHLLGTHDTTNNYIILHCLYCVVLYNVHTYTNLRWWWQICALYYVLLTLNYVFKYVAREVCNYLMVRQWTATCWTPIIQNELHVMHSCLMFCTQVEHVNSNLRLWLSCELLTDSIAVIHSIDVIIDTY